MSTKSKLSRKEKRQRRLQKMHAKYKLTIRDTKTFAEVFSLRLSLSNVLLFITTCAVVLIFVVYLVIAYTPLKEYIIPNYPELEEREKIERNAELVDSLEYEMKLYAQKMQILQTILNGEDPSAYELLDSIVVTNENYANLNFDLSPADSMLRMEIQENEALNVNFHANTAGVRIENLFFYPPINGIVSSNFSNGHFGTDVVAAENSIIHAVLAGTVILDSWTVETGYTIMIQHSNDFVSVYKHNSKLLKKTGDHVNAGEGIALVGNTGNLTVGPHLHFELWHEGKPVNSENYIVY
ncbi:MAG: M23 family metallopeptidase [Bacteroidales bacterium]|nr:M23 family metallopeptidase [Bacteroidales bacterium]